MSDETQTPTAGTATEPATKPLRIMSAGELLTSCGYTEGFKSERRPREWLFHNEGRGFIPRGHVGFIGGRGGTGKSTLALQAALSVVTGRPVLPGDIRDGSLTYVKPKAGVPERAFVCFAEEGPDDIADRLLAMCKGFTKEQMGLVASNLHLMSLRGTTAYLVNPDGTSSDSFKEIETRLKDGDPWALMVFDPLTRFQREAETDAAEATLCLAMFEKFTMLPGKPTVLLVHHATKQDKKDDIEAALSLAALRGSSAIADAGRFVLMMAPDRAEYNGRVEVIVRLRVAKTSYGSPDFQTMQLKLTEAGVRLATQKEIDDHAELKPKGPQKNTRKEPAASAGEEPDSSRFIEEN